MRLPCLCSCMYRGISARLFEQAAPAVVKPHGSKPSRLLRSALHVGAMVAPAAATGRRTPTISPTNRGWPSGREEALFAVLRGLDRSGGFGSRRLAAASATMTASPPQSLMRPVRDRGDARPLRGISLKNRPVRGGTCVAGRGDCPIRRPIREIPRQKRGLECLRRRCRRAA